MCIRDRFEPVKIGSFDREKGVSYGFLKKPAWRGTWGWVVIEAVPDDKREFTPISGAVWDRPQREL